MKLTKLTEALEDPIFLCLKINLNRSGRIYGKRGKYRMLEDLHSSLTMYSGPSFTSRRRDVDGGHFLRIDELTCIAY